MSNKLYIDSNNKFVSFSESYNTLLSTVENKEYGEYLKNDDFTIINDFNIIKDFILTKKNRKFTKAEETVFKNYINNKFLNINKLYINIFKLCNLDKDDIIFNNINIKANVKPLIISFDSQNKLQVKDLDNKIINTEEELPSYIKKIIGLSSVLISNCFIFDVNKNNFIFDTNQGNWGEKWKENYKYIAYSNIIGIPHSYLIQDSPIIEFTFTILSNRLKNNDKQIYLIDYISLIKKYFIILVTKLNKSSISFNTKISNFYYFINCISILLVIMQCDEKKKYINNYETFLTNLINILPDMNCNITNELYTYNPDFIINQNNNVNSYFTNTMYNIFYICCSILCCICILFSLYKIFKKK